VSKKNNTDVRCYSFNVSQPICIIFGRNVAKRPSCKWYFDFTWLMFLHYLGKDELPKIVTFYWNTIALWTNTQNSWKYIQIFTWLQLNLSWFTKQLTVYTKPKLWREHSIIPSVTTHSLFTKSVIMLVAKSKKGIVICGALSEMSLTSICG